MGFQWQKRLGYRYNVRIKLIPWKVLLISSSEKCGVEFQDPEHGNLFGVVFIESILYIGFFAYFMAG